MIVAVMSRQSCELEIERFLKTGQNDPLFRSWEGEIIADRLNNGDTAHRQALLAAVKRLVPNAQRITSLLLSEGNLSAWTRTKVEPMVCGLFPRYCTF